MIMSLSRNIKLIMFLLTAIVTVYLSDVYTFSAEDNTSSDKWVDDYLKLASEWHNKYSKDEYEAYKLMYLDNDDIPELLLRSTDNVYSANIYTVINGQITHLSLYNFNGEKYKQYNEYTDSGEALADYYLEKKDLCYFITHGTCWISHGIYVLRKGKLEEIFYVKYAWEQVYDKNIDDYIGDNEDFLYGYRKKNGTLCCRHEEKYNDYSNNGNNGEEYCDQLLKKYMSKAEKEYGFDHNDMKEIDSEMNKYNEFVKKINSMKKKPKK